MESIPGVTWAAGCRYKHPNRAIHPEYNNVGQNLWAVNHTTIDLTSVIDAWYNEKADYTYDTMECVPGKKCRRYTQVVWAASSHVGCAVHRCASLGLYLVCNYSPAGNMRGSKPYTKGPYCSKCGMELDGARTNCATPRVQVLERVVSAPRSATTVLKWTSKLVGVPALRRDGEALTARRVVKTRMRTATPSLAGRRPCVTRMMSRQVVLLCAGCVLQIQTLSPVSAAPRIP